MSGILNEIELDGIRDDANLIIGIDADGTNFGSTQILLQREGEPTLDRDTLKYTPALTTVYEGTAIIFPIVFRRSRQEFVVEEDIRPRSYRALIPWDSNVPWLEDILTVTAASDADFVGRSMRVIDVMFESDQGLRRFDLIDIADDGEAQYP